MLKLVSGQHTKAPGGTLRGPPGLSVPPSADANLSVLGPVKSPAEAPAAVAGSQQQTQQGRQGSSKPTSATPKTPQNLLAMVHLLDQQLQQLEQQYDGQEQEADMVQQGLQQASHSMEVPTVLSTAQGASAAAASYGLHQQSAARLLAAAHTYHAAGQLPQPPQQPHTVEVPNLLHRRAAATAGKAAATAGPLHGPAHRPQHDLAGHKAADQVPQHSRGLMAAGAYVLQPLKSAAGAPRRRSTSPEEQPLAWLQQASLLAGPNIPQPGASVAAALSQQQLLPPPRPLQLHLPQQPPQHTQGQQDALAFQQAIARRAAAEASAVASAAATAAAAQAAANTSSAGQHAALLQQRQMLHQQQQLLLRLQQERQQQQPRSQPPAPRQQPQQQPQQRQRRQPVQDTAVDMEIEQAAGALDMLSEIAAAAAAAEEMYAGVPSPLRPDLLNAQMLAAGSFSSRNRPEARSMQAGAPGPSGPSAAAAAAMARQQAPAILQQGFSTVGTPGGVSDRLMQAKRNRQGTGGGSGSPAAPGSARSAAAAAGATTEVEHASTKFLKRTKTSAWGHAAEGLQEQHSHDSSTDRLFGAAADGAIVADSDTRMEQLGPLGVSHSGIAADPAAQAAPVLPDHIRAAVAELAALVAAQGTAGLQHDGPAAQAGQQMAQAYLAQGPAAPGNAGYLMFPAELYGQQGPPAASGSAGAAVRGPGLTASTQQRNQAPAAAAAAGGGGSYSGPVMVPRRPAHKFSTSKLGGAAPSGQLAAAQTAAADAEAAEAVDAAAHDLAMFAAAAAAAAAAGSYHRMPASADPMAHASSPQHPEGRRKRKCAAAAAAFIAAAVDDGLGAAADELDGDSDGAREATPSRAHQRRHNNERQHSVPAAAPQNLDLLAAAAASSPGPAAAMAGEFAAAPRGFAANPALAALAAEDALPGRSSSTGTAGSRGRASSVTFSGSYNHDPDYDTDGADGDAYVPHGEEGDAQDGDSDDDERRGGSKHRTTKERVLSNRLAASRSYQRRKEEVLRLESNHARLQMERQALQHALQEAEQELQVHRDVAAAFASHHQALTGANQGQELTAAAAAFAAGHSAMHGVLAQRVHGAFEHQQRQRRVHADRVEEAALAAAAAAEGLYTDGAGSSGSGSI